MAYLISALLFSLTFAIANSDPLWIDHPYNKTIGPYNLHTVATLTIEYDANISICIVAAEFGLPAYTQYNEDVCLWFFQWNTTGEAKKTNLDLPLLNIAYTVGMYFVDPAQFDPKHNATVGVLDIAAATCATDLIFDNATGTCLPVVQISDWNDTRSVNFDQGETKIFVWDNPTNVGYFELSYAPGPGLSAETMILFARYNGAPSKYYNDGHESNGKITISIPKPGKWVFYLRALEKGKATIFFTGRVCGEFLAGKDCNIHVAEAADVLNLNLTATSTVYYRVVVNMTNINSTNIASLLVSLATTNSTLNPWLFATRGQIPDKNNADIKNCNRAHCDQVRSIMHNSTKDGEQWFLAVMPSVAGNVTAALWFGQPCIPNCEQDSHGQCTDAGLCDCEIDYDGINCNNSKGLGPQYIVLIIIASLVVASAFIGFVAWAYMRQKRGAYEPLT